MQKVFNVGPNECQFIITASLLTLDANDRFSGHIPVDSTGELFGKYLVYTRGTFLFNDN